MKDFGLVLTTVANIVFDLVLITMLGDDRVKGDSSKQFFSLAVNLVNLMKVITGQQLILHNLTDAFRDINEHRLSKFEFALLMVKIQEQLLEDDIQYNFVEHLYSGPQIPLWFQKFLSGSRNFFWEVSDCWHGHMVINFNAGSSLCNAKLGTFY